MPDTMALPDELDAVHIATETKTRGFRLHLPSVAEGEVVDAALAQKVLEREALRWTYLLRSRKRWVGDLRARERNEDEARKALAQIGIDALELSQLAASQTLVVRVPYTGNEQTHWEARVFPWEYVLAAATRAQRQQNTTTGRPQPLTVMRELQLQQPTARVNVAAPTGCVPLHILFVECLPAELRDAWSLSDELDKLCKALKSVETQWRVLRHPSLEELVEAMRSHQPQLVHFGGFDSHQGLRELRSFFGEEALVDLGPSGAKPPPDETDPQPEFPSIRMVDKVMANRQLMLDGVLLRGLQGYPRLVRAHELAVALKSSGHTAYLVTFNMWNTAARVAPLVVAEGVAMAAFGFQDVFDDALAEFVYASLYQQLIDKGWNLPEAFRETWLSVRQQPESTDATGITLWAGAPVLPRHEAPSSAALKPPSRELLRCDIKPHAELNYAVLHNAQPLFVKFVLETDLPADDLMVDVAVTVHMGSETARFARRVAMRQRRLSLTREIHVPLTAEVARTVHESINSSVAIEVRANGTLLYADTHRLRLLPVDQWRDNRHDGRWLPSFVQPRDPAVMRAVEQAQRYVRVLRDDPVAGFEGYQLAEVNDEESLLGVDRQVEALWATLLHDWRLGYVNPPPTYSSTLDSQRLRVPSAVLANRSGTCIDLALLFAACLELIDIYPVIFLLEGHALPGWWRHASYRDEYKEMWERSYADVVHASATENSLANAQVVSWHTGKASYDEVRRWIRQRKLVPIETVRLTENCGFAEAIDAGVAALSDRRDFDSMLDIVTARHEQVTPLPLLKELP